MRFSTVAALLTLGPAAGVLAVPSRVRDEPSAKYDLEARDVLAPRAAILPGLAWPILVKTVWPAVAAFGSAAVIWVFANAENIEAALKDLNEQLSVMASSADIDDPFSQPPYSEEAPITAREKEMLDIVRTMAEKLPATNGGGGGPPEPPKGPKFNKELAKKIAYGAAAYMTVDAVAEKLGIPERAIEIITGAAQNTDEASYAKLAELIRNTEGASEKLKAIEGSGESPQDVIARLEQQVIDGRRAELDRLNKAIEAQKNKAGNGQQGNDGNPKSEADVCATVRRMIEKRDL